MSTPRNAFGFTLIELMITLAILGVLVSIGVPRYFSMVTKSKEGVTKGNLGNLRSAISIYYGDNESIFPTDNLACLTIGSKYIPSIPPTTIPPNHDPASNVYLQTTPTDVGSWSYNNTDTAPRWGILLVGCTHSDTRGQIWTAY